MKHPFFGIDLTDCTVEEGADLKRFIEQEIHRPLAWWAKLIIVAIVCGGTITGVLLLANSIGG